MSYGDTNKFSRPMTYKDNKMRSVFECKFAYLLDTLKIKWKYEPQLFHLSNGIFYKPDFYLPELKLWIEVKGVIGENNKQISEIFCKDNKTALLLISENKAYFYDYYELIDQEERVNQNEDEINLGGEESFQLGKCSYCGKYFLCTAWGIFSCRHCNGYSGDHDILYSFDNGFNELKKWVKNGPTN